MDRQYDVTTIYDDGLKVRLTFPTLAQALRWVWSKRDAPGVARMNLASWGGSMSWL